MIKQKKNLILSKFAKNINNIPKEKESMENVKKEIKKVAILTNGGDAPGLNAVIRAIVKAGEEKKIESYRIYRRI